MESHRSETRARPSDTPPEEVRVFRFMAPRDQDQRSDVALLDCGANREE